MEEKSLLEIAIKNMAGKKTPQNIYKFLDEVLSIKGISESDENYIDLKAQLYTDMITSARFVFCGEDTWNLKENESLDLWDKDASFFNTDEEEDIEEEDDVTLDDYNYGDEDDSDDDEDEDEEDDDEDMDNHYDDDDDDYDEKEYNDMMDDYEDLYDEK